MLLGAAGERLVGHGAAVQSAGPDRQLGIDVHLEAGAEHLPAQPLQLGAIRLHIPLPGVVAVPDHGAAQQCSGLGPLLNAALLGACTLQFGLGFVELALPALAAHHSQLGGDGVQLELRGLPLGGDGVGGSGRSGKFGRDRLRVGGGVTLGEGGHGFVGLPLLLGVGRGPGGEGLVGDGGAHGRQLLMRGDGLGLGDPALGPQNRCGRGLLDLRRGSIGRNLMELLGVGAGVAQRVAGRRQLGSDRLGI